jgi:two-component system, cell cycle sensor histidine kinase and response regulator CckA
MFDKAAEPKQLAGRISFSDRNFQAVVEGARDGIIVTDTSGLITFFNRGAETMFGWEREEVLGLSVMMLMPEKYRTPLLAGVKKRLLAGGDVGILHSFDVRRKDGGLFAANISLTVCMDGTEPVFVGIVRDVSEHLEARAALEKSEANFRALAEVALEAVLVHRNTRVIHANKEAATLLGRATPEELYGQTVLDLIHPDERAIFEEHIRLVSAGHEITRHEHRILRADGAVLTVEIAAKPIIFDGEAAHVLVARDVTEQKQLTIKAMQMDRMIAVGTLAAGVGHEINNPLSYIVANLELIASELPMLAGTQATANQAPPSAETAAERTRMMTDLRQAVDDAREGAQRVRKIVRDLRVFSRGENDRKEAVVVTRVFESAVSMAWNEIRHRARLIKDYGPIPRVWINEARLSQVFLNLLINAAHAIPEGRADANEIRVVTSTDEKGNAVIDVHDSGTGIPPDILPRIFDPFFTTKPVGFGTGLGLGISRNIVREAEGAIEVESEIGGGTRFRIILPPLDPEFVQLAAVDVPVVRPGRRGRILIVDDDPMVGRALLRVLARDHDVTLAMSGSVALEFLSVDNFDLILSDLMMPEMTGMDLHARLSVLFPDHARRMIFLTGGAFTPRAREFLDRIPNLHFEKPVDSLNLRSLVRDLLD